MEKVGLLIFCHAIHIYRSPAEPGYALPLQTVYPDLDLDLLCLPLSM